MIRPAALHDLERLTEFGQKFHEASPLSEVSDFDPGSYSGQMADWIQGKGPLSAGVFVAVEDRVVGMIVGLVYPAWFNAAQKTGQDLIWWLEPDHRNFETAHKMIKALEYWAKACDAKWFIMACTETMSPDRIEAWYKRRGYTLTERHYVKELL